jgi:outer membrane receptor protein involved in Fe transport
MADRKPELGPRGQSALAAAVSAAVTAPGAAQAQDSAALDEIIVTATKREARLQEVPLSISAFDDEALTRRGLQQLDDYAKFVPGLSFGTREPGGTSIVFRGVAASGIQYGASSSAGIYLDEQPITIGGLNPDPRQVDIERLEALRGPQGTLYGASSQSGTLRIITNKPDPSGFDAWVDTSVSAVDDGEAGYDLSGMVNVPLVADTLALRLVGFSAQEAGYIDNVVATSQGGTFRNARYADDDVNGVDYAGGRAALRWNINDRWTADLSAIFQDVSADGIGDVSCDLEYVSRDDCRDDPNVSNLQQARFQSESLDEDWYQVALTLNASLPFGDAVIAASYFDRDFHYDADASDYEFAFNCPKYDVDGNPVVGCVPNFTSYDFGGDPRGFATNDQSDDFKTIEMRLASPAGSESRWAWLVGVFYNEHDRTSSFDSYVRGYPDTPSWYYFNYLEENVYSLNSLPLTDRWFLGRYDQEVDQTAVFGELSFDLTENFTLTAGGRWFDYDRSFALRQESPEGSTAFNFLDDVTESSESDFVTKLNLTYRVDDDKIVYATYSEGFRDGGSNPLKAAATLPRTFDSDEITNYELGAKTELLDKRIRFNVAAYYMEWDDFQAQVEDPAPAIFNLGYVNFPSAEIKGFESDFAVVVTEQWLIDGMLSYNDAEISENATLTTTDEDGTEYTISVQDGARLPLTPDWSAALGIEYRPNRQLMGAQPFGRFDYAYVGESINALEGLEAVVGTTDVYEHDAYQTGDFRVGLETDTWTATFFVDNVWDERGEQFMSNRWAKQRLSLIRPRTYGLSFRFRFGE